MKDTRDILGAEGSCADAVAVGPPLVTESAEEIPNRVIPGAVLEFAGAAAGREGFCVDRHSGQERLRVRGEEDYDSKPHTESGALHVPQDTHHFSLTPGRAPYEGNDANKRRPGAPKKNSAGSTEHNGRCRDPEHQERDEQKKIDEAPGAYKHGSGPVSDYPGNGRRSIQRAQFAKFFGGNRWVEKSMAEDGLHNPKRDDDQGKNHVDKKEAAQFGLGVQQGVAHEEQWDVVEINLQPEKSVDEGWGCGIENLQDPKPHEKQQRNKEGRPESGHLLPAVRDEKRKIDHRGQNVLGEVDGHVVAEEFPDQILE